LRINVADRLEVTDKRVTSAGYLAVRANIAKDGVYQYARGEVGLPGNPNEMIGVYRSHDFVFDSENLATFAHKPVCIGHPKEPVNSKNWKNLAVGAIGDKVWEAEDRRHVQVDMLLMDQAGIDAAQSSHRELSCGYSCSIEAEDGVSPEGEAYQAVMKGPLIADHLALVPRGRAITAAFVGDAWPTEITDTKNPPASKRKKSMLIDGLKIDLSDEEAVASLVKKLTDARSVAEAALIDAQDKAKVAAKTAETALADATKAHDTAMGQKDAEIAELQGKIVDQSQIDALAQAKADVVDKAKAALGDKAPDFAGKSVPDVRRLSVAVKFGDAAVADKSDDYVEARFDAMVSTADVTDSFRQSVLSPVVNFNANDAAAKSKAARDAMIAREAAA